MHLRRVCERGDRFVDGRAFINQQGNRLAVHSPAGACVLKGIQIRKRGGNLELAAVLVLIILAFAVRFHRIDFYSLSEDESAKWRAIQEYRSGQFAGVNSEHPMLPKMLAWGSIAAGERWNRLAVAHQWPSLRPEGWLRLPNALFGSLTAAVLYLLCRQMMGCLGSFAAALFWALSPLAIALNRLTKEETPLTFFTLLACYLYCRAELADGDRSARRWFDLSAAGFGLALASQYIIHLLGLNGLAWVIARKRGLELSPTRFSFVRFYLVLFATFIVANPVILSPTNYHAILNWLHHDGVRHTGYDFDGTLYLNFASRLFAGLPWFYYAWLLLVKTPVPALLCILVGGALLLRDRRSLASCFFLSFGLVQFAGLSVSGAKFIRYSLPLLPFLYLAGGYAVHRAWQFARDKNLSLRVAAIPLLVVMGAPLFNLLGWAPFYSFYLNSIGGGKQNITRYFAPDEVSEFDTREVAQQVCGSSPMGAKLATARPMSMAYYLKTCGRSDISVVPLYEPTFVPQDGDLIVLEPSRRFFETQKYFNILENSTMSHIDVRVGPVRGSTIYLFNPAAASASRFPKDSTIAQLRTSPLRWDTHVQESGSTSLTRFGSSAPARRTAQ